MTGKVLSALGLAILLSQTPLTARADTILVPADHPTIGAALEASRSGDRIEVSPGVYQENNLVMPEGVVLIGMGSEPADVVLDGNMQGRIILCESITQASSIENLTFANGRASGASSYDQSGGALLSSNSSLRLTNCVFSGNQADSHGGAIRCNNSTILINDCLFIDNSAPNGGGGAVDCSYGSSPLFRNCTFEDNQASWGGALSCRSDSSPQVINSQFRNNSAIGDLGFGGAVFSDFQATPLFAFSTFTGNSARYGGALASFQDAETNLENCTVTGNSAEFSGGGLFCHESSPRVTASIIAFQNGTGIAAQGGAVPMISCTDLFGNSQGDWVGTISDQADVLDNLSADPVFCAESPGTSSEFSLQDDSPCGPDANECGPLGAWPVGCNAVAAQLSIFEADWSGPNARLSWQAISNGETPAFRLTGAIDEEGAPEWEIPYREEGGGHFVGEDDQSQSDSGKKYVFRLYLVNARGETSLLGETKLVSVPDFPGIRDLKASPNPFNPMTTISFHLGNAQRARISIYTVDGRRVKVLASRPFDSGPQEVQWDGTDASGRHASTGTYIALVEGRHQMQTIKLTLIK